MNDKTIQKKTSSTNDLFYLNEELDRLVCEYCVIKVDEYCIMDFSYNLLNNLLDIMYSKEDILNNHCL